MSVNDRLKKVIEELGYNPTSFSKKIGLKSNVQITNIVSGRLSKPSFETLELIHSFFGDINFDWLVTGRGDKYIINDNSYKPSYDNNILQHYTTANAIIGILRDMQLNYSLQNNSNDIKERRLIYHDSVLRGKIKKEDALNYKWISFFKKDNKREVRQPKMYDLYADFHSGGCIEFNKKNLLLKNKNIKIVEIEYDEFFLKQQPTIEEEIRHKYYQWSNENECRIIYNGEDKSIDIRDCVEKIYLGCEFCNDKLRIAEFCNVIEEKDIPINKIAIIDVSGIGFLSVVANKQSPCIETSGLQAKKIIPYFSEQYRERYNLNTDEEQIRINIKEEKFYKEKYIVALEEKDLIQKQLVDSLQKAILLHEKIGLLNGELGYIKKELAEKVSDVISALTLTAS
ncbi:hypothetical protein FACS189451_11540 [Bacteroidia bacterium]|nr:hypothetical protein FACS189451_11540 [Bacteroidia bacterium]